MKTYIDLEQTYKNLFLASKRLKNRFIRYWGTETIDGVEVFKKRLQVWPGTDTKNVQKILKMFGMYESIKTANFEGITSYYLWLNPRKTGELDDITTDILVNRFNSILEIGKTFTVNLNFQDETDPTKFTGWSKEQIYQFVDDNYGAMIDSQYVEARGDSLHEEVIGLYILLDDDTHFDVKVVDAIVTPIAHNVRTSYNNVRTTYTTGISLTLSVTQKSNITADSAIIARMLEENNQLAQRKIAEAATTDSYVAARDITWIPAVFTALSGGSVVTNDVWYKGQLRVQVTDSSYLDRDKFATILAAAMDTGYTKKKTSFWKKVLSVILVVVAIILAVPSGGVSMGTLGAFAVNLGIAGLVLTGIQYLLAKAGQTGWAEYLGNFVQVVSIVSMITGIAAFIQNVAKQGLLKAVGIVTETTTASGEVVQLTAKEAMAATVDKAVSAVTGAFSDLGTAALKLLNPASIGEVLPTIGEIGSNKVISIGSKVAQMVMDQRVKGLKSEIRDLDEKVQQSQEELNELTEREVHIALEDLKFYTKPLDMDNIAYEVDYLYEGTMLNIGRPSFYPIGLNIRDKA